MKRIIIITGILAVLVTGCEVHPYASFTANYTTVQPNEVITFTNHSDRAVSFDWDFGDGYTSTEVNPRHAYSSEGTYQVSLRATSKDNNVDVAYMTVDVIYTLLEISVIDNEINNLYITHAFVILYPSLDAWVNDYGDVASGYTDDQGVITFAGLDEQQYYVWAEKVPAFTQVDGYDNYNFYLDGLYSFIRTSVLVPFALNTWTAWVDYFEVYQSPDKSVKKFRREKYEKGKIKDTDSSFVLVDVSK
jgi:PKD repeat protein